MAKRYDDLTEFTNISPKTFVGKWEQESYVIEPGETKVYPLFLARHFAKKLCDREMISKYLGTDNEKRLQSAMRIDSKERIAFQNRCQGKTENIDQLEELSMKEQIEAQQRDYEARKRTPKQVMEEEILHDAPALNMDPNQVPADDGDDETEVVFGGSAETASNAIRNNLPA